MLTDGVFSADVAGVAALKCKEGSQAHARGAEERDGHINVNRIGSAVLELKVKEYIFVKIKSQRQISTQISPRQLNRVAPAK